MNEVWKDIPGYEGLYQVSNLGNVKSLSRIILRNGIHPFLSKEKLLKLSIDNWGYPRVSLFRNSNQSYSQVHQLVAMVFLNHKPDRALKLVVDHINNIKTDNRLENLQIISQRENTSKDKKNKTSKYTGVSWHSNYKKWISGIRINGKIKHLGYFTCEVKASEAYINKLKEIQNV